MNDPLIQNFAIAFGVLIALSLAFGVWRRRENLFRNLRRLVFAIAIGTLIFYFFWQEPELQPAAPFTAFIATALIFWMRPARKRKLGPEVRRRVIAKWELKTGQKFSPKFHEIDHIVPFSKGGSSTEDNLRVMYRGENRSKGAKSPWWDVMGRR